MKLARPVLIAAWIAGGTAILVLRQSGVPALDTVWAEDGEVFISDAFREGSFGPIAAPYAGYIHLLSRVIAGIVSLFPVRWTAMLLALLSAVVVSGLSAYVYVASRRLYQTDWARVLLAAMVVLLPAAGWESINNVTNIQWSLILPCAVALAAPPGGTTTVASVVAFTAGSSSPITLVLLPFALYRLLRPSSGAARIVPMAFLVGAVLQLAAASVAAEDPFRAPTDPLAVPGLYGLRVAGGLLAGEWVLPQAWSTFGSSFSFAMLVVAGGLVALGAMGTRSLRPLVGAIGSVALFAFPVVVRGTSLLTPLGNDLNLAVGSKWVVGPSLVLLMAVLLGIDPNLRAGSSARWRMPSLAIAIALTGALTASVVAGFRVTNDRSGGPRWSEGVRSAARACGAGAGTVTIRMSPIGWNARVPCGRVGDDQAFVATTSIWRPNKGHTNLSER